MTERLRRLLTVALTAATPNLRAVAKRAGVSYAAIRAWKLGSRTPARAVIARLARALRAQAHELERHADALDREDP